MEFPIIIELRMNVRVVLGYSLKKCIPRKNSTLA